MFRGRKKPVEKNERLYNCLIEGYSQVICPSSSVELICPVPSESMDAVNFPFGAKLAHLLENSASALPCSTSKYCQAISKAIHRPEKSLRHLKTIRVRTPLRVSTRGTEAASYGRCAHCSRRKRLSELGAGRIGTLVECIYGNHAQCPFSADTFISFPSSTGQPGRKRVAPSLLFPRAQSALLP